MPLSDRYVLCWSQDFKVRLTFVQSRQALQSYIKSFWVFESAAGDASNRHVAQPAKGPGAKTLADQVAGFASHDSYHVGQMGYVCKALAYPAIAE